MRLIIYLLILANVGFYAWHVYHPAKRAQSARLVPAWPAGVKRLTLFREGSEPTEQAAPLSRPPKAPASTERKAPQHSVAPPQILPPKTPPAAVTGAGSAPAVSPSSSAGGASGPADGHRATAPPPAVQPKLAPGSAGQAKTPAPAKTSQEPATPVQKGKGASDGNATGAGHSGGSDSGPSSSRPPSASTGKVPTAATDTATAARSTSVCYRVGPVAGRAAARALKSRLTQQGLSARVQKIQATRPGDYWVFLPPMSHEAAVNISEELAAKGVKDYFIGKDNFISLGIFNAAQPAEQRRQQIAEMGYTPKIKTHLTTQVQYWLAVRHGAGTAISGAAWSRLLATAPGTRRKSVDCD